jgi:hypothetical protein
MARRCPRRAGIVARQPHYLEKIGQAQEHEIVVFNGVERIRVADAEKQAAFELELPRIPEPALRLDEQRRRLILDIDDRTDEGGRVGDIIEREPGACS